MTNNWLGVVSAEHVRRAVSLGIAQLGHGKRSGLAKLKQGDGLIYYSAQEKIGERPTLRQFTAIGTVADDEIWQADEGCFQPFRRRINYLPASPAPVAELKSVLELTSDPHWGYQLRRGLIELSEHDWELIRDAMLAGAEPRT